MAKSGVDINFKTGHAIRKIDAIVDGLSLIRSRLAEISDNYCDVDGSELEIIDTQSVNGNTIDKKRCPKCGEYFCITNMITESATAMPDK